MSTFLCIVETLLLSTFLDLFDNLRAKQIQICNLEPPCKQQLNKEDRQVGPFHCIVLQHVPTWHLD